MRTVSLLVLLLSGCGGSVTSAARAPVPPIPLPPALSASLDLGPDEAEELRARLATGVVVARVSDEPAFVYSCRSPVTYGRPRGSGHVMTDPASRQAVAAPRFDDPSAHTGPLTFSTSGDRFEANRHLDAKDWFDG